jgi:hypothetical protein
VPSTGVRKLPATRPQLNCVAAQYPTDTECFTGNPPYSNAIGAQHDNEYGDFYR